ncbi:hypothetical protein CI109_103875 [Kwoniella shandongensis]|uniref:JmjN domain-containing protein n=1 Tax=Kwoniella shandongensis TaxID=1734106 RepID=A0AAJ8MVX1_9TREE
MLTINQLAPTTAIRATTGPDSSSNGLMSRRDQHLPLCLFINRSTSHSSYQSPSMSKNTCPVVKPSEEEFKDFVSFIDGIFDIGLEEGMIKVIPPIAANNDHLAGLLSAGTQLSSRKCRFSPPPSDPMLLYSHHAVYTSIVDSRIDLGLFYDNQREETRRLRNLPSMLKDPFKQGYAGIGRDELWEGKWSTEKAFPLDTCEEVLGQVWEGLDDERGVEVVEGLSMADIPPIPDPTPHPDLVNLPDMLHDSDAVSIHYQRFGAPSVWYTTAPDCAEQVEGVLRATYPEQECSEFLQHFPTILSPVAFTQFDIDYHTAVLYPNEILLTFPRSYTQGVNLGFNGVQHSETYPRNHARSWALRETFRRELGVLLDYTAGKRVDLGQFPLGGESDVGSGGTGSSGVGSATAGE